MSCRVAFGTLTSEYHGGHGRQQIASEVQLVEVRESSKGRRVNLTNFAVGQAQFLQIVESVTSENFTGQRLKVIFREVEHLRLEVDGGRHRDLALTAAIHVTFAYKIRIDPLLRTKKSLFFSSDRERDENIIRSNLSLSLRKNNRIDRARKNKGKITTSLLLY